MLRRIRVKSKEKLAERTYLYIDKVSAEPVVFHWKYKLNDIDVSEEVIVDTLSPEKSSQLENTILERGSDFIKSSAASTTARIHRHSSPVAL